MAEPKNLVIEAQDGVVRVTISREAALNALNVATLEELVAAVDGIDPSTRVVILTGAGRAFVAGADISQMVDLSAAEATRFARLGHALGERLGALDAVVIAEVNGFALGGGCELMLACDFAIASEKAKLGQPEVGLGVTPGFGGTTRLVRAVGLPRALQLLTTGATISANEAHALGLVNEVAAPDALRARVDEIAAAIVKNGPRAVALAKRAARFGAEVDLDAANAYEQEIFGLCFTTEDQSEGMRAFTEKRKPQWSGR